MGGGGGIGEAPLNSDETMISLVNVFKTEHFRWVRIVGVLRPKKSPLNLQLKTAKSPSISMQSCISSISMKTPYTNRVFNICENRSSASRTGFSHLWHGRETQASIQLIPSGLDLMEAGRCQYPSVVTQWQGLP